MRLSTTLFSYIARRFLASFLGIFFILLALILLFDTIELLRRFVSKPGISLVQIIEMAFFKLPHMGHEALPFAVLFAGMASFWHLARHYELVVIRSAGISVWQFMMPVLGVATVLGIFQITLLDPLASIMLSRFIKLEAFYLQGQKNTLTISKSGFWLRQAINPEERSVMHAEYIYQQGHEIKLNGVTIFIYQGKNKFVRRIDAKNARLESKNWRLFEVWHSEPEKQPVFEKEILFPTNLTLNYIQNSFALPETMSFWTLPSFIDAIEKSGFSALRYHLYFHRLLSMPMLLFAMILIAAMFTLKQFARRSDVVFIITGGISAGFLLYFLSDVVFAMGLSDNIPVVLAAWAPSSVSILIGITMLFHLEDG